MTAEQYDTLYGHYPDLVEAIEVINSGIRATIEMQIDPTLLGKIARMWQVDTKRDETETHDIYTLAFTHESVAVNLYALIPKTAKR
jgi:hypothetical protein